MDDFKVSTLRQCTHELCARLTNILTAPIVEGIRSIFDEGWNLCQQTQETAKYLMTFQNLLSRVPKWNENTIQSEVQRILQKSGCSYLEDLITCVHIIQLKTLTAVRVASKMKKIDIDIPKLDHFIHKVYIFTARKLYSNVYLFERHTDFSATDADGTSLIVQKHSRDIELIVNDCIMNAVRDTIPIENILRAYMDETVQVEEEITVGPAPEECEQGPSYVPRSVFSDTGSEPGGPHPHRLTIENVDNNPVKNTLTFNQVDSVVTEKDELALVSKESPNYQTRSMDASYIADQNISPSLDNALTLTQLTSASPTPHRISSGTADSAPAPATSARGLSIGSSIPAAAPSSMDDLDGIIDIDFDHVPAKLESMDSVKLLPARANNADPLLLLDDIEIL